MLHARKIGEILNHIMSRVQQHLGDTYEGRHGRLVSASDL